MPLTLDETITAIASPPGGAARGIIRISGSGVPGCLTPNFHAADETNLDHLRVPTAVEGRLELSGTHLRIPCRVYLWPTARSFTREPSAEIHMVGSPPLLEAVLGAICRAGARLAEPGEFTLRAFLAGRIDLTQAEAVLGVVDACDRDELDIALDQLAGGLAHPLTALRDSLLDLLAHLEAGLDFAEDEVEFITVGELTVALDAAVEQVEVLLRQMRGRTVHEDRSRVVLVGWPNVGKSSLFNTLAAAEALVSPQAGTTRDYLTAKLDLAGLAVELVDTAGAETGRTAGSIAAAAQNLGSEARQRAAIEVLCLDASRRMNDWERAELQSDLGRRRLIVLTKCDLPRNTDYAGEGTKTSTIDRQGIDALRSALRTAILGRERNEARSVASTAGRCRQSLERAADSLARARRLAARAGVEELIASEIRVALTELGKVVGAVYTDDVLDRIFSRFCIGK